MVPGDIRGPADCHGPREKPEENFVQLAPNATLSQIGTILLSRGRPGGKWLQRLAFTAHVSDWLESPNRRELGRAVSFIGHAAPRGVGRAVSQGYRGDQDQR